MNTHQYFVNELNKALNSLKKNGIQGVRSTEQVIDGVLNETYTDETTIVYNKHFELTYSQSLKHVDLRTVQSNQLVTSNWISELQLLNQRKDVICSYIKAIKDFE